MTKSVFTHRYQRFREFLVEKRKEKNLKQSDVALRLSKPQSYVSKYENGERRIDVIEYLDIAKAIGFDPKSVFDEDYEER